jgi:hypothetical protein
MCVYLQYAQEVQYLLMFFGAANLMFSMFDYNKLAHRVYERKLEI